MDFLKLTRVVCVVLAAGIPSACQKEAGDETSTAAVEDCVSMLDENGNCIPVVSGANPGGATGGVQGGIAPVVDGEPGKPVGKQEPHSGTSGSGTGSQDVKPDTVAPEVDAGADLITNAEISLNATVSDDSEFTLAWTMVSGPGVVTFGTPDGENTTASADADGSYLLRLTATDAAGNASYDELYLYWDASPPEVNAGPDLSHHSQITQDATVSDESDVSYLWTQQSGAGAVIFGSPTAEDTTIDALEDGTWVIRLTVTDIAGNVGYDEFTYTRNSLYPDVEAGPDIVAGSLFSRDATVTNPVNATYQWSMQSGPGLVNFGTASAEDTTIEATSDGHYTLRLTATNDGAYPDFDEFVLTWDTSAPTVEAGDAVTANGQITIDATTADLTAKTYSWSKQSGPGGLNFGSPDQEDTSVTADATGTYVIRLTVTDEAGHIAYDEVSLTWDSTPPVVNAGPDIDTSAQVVLDATVYDETALTYQWSKVSGPGAVTFGTPTAVDTTIMADQFGVYTVRLTATDVAGNTTSDELTFKWEAFSHTWNFQNASQYTFDDEQIAITAAVAGLAAANNVEPDDSQADFNEGTYTQSEWNGDDAVTLSAAGLAAKSGSFRSQVFDAGAPVDWKQISWVEGSDLPFLADLPDNKASGAGFSQNVDMTGNVFLLHMNELAGSTKVYDASGEGHVATCVGIQCPDVGEQGRVGLGSYRFRTADADQFSVPHHSSLNVTGDASFMAWVKIGSAPSLAAYILEKGQDDATDNYGFLIFKSGSNYLPGFEFNDAASGTYRFYNAATAGNLAVGQWHHVAVVVDDANDKLHFYVNGVATNPGGITNTHQLNGTYTNNLLIAQQNYGSGHLTLDGWLDEVAIFDRALSPAEIQEVYLRGSVRLELKVRGCDDASCSANPAFVGPDGTGASSFTGAAAVGNIPGITGKQFFQYEAAFKTSSTSFSPKLHGVTLQSVSSANPDLVPVTGRSFTSLSGFSQAVEIAHIGTVRYQLSNDGNTWYWHNGSNWVVAGGYAESNTPAAINSNISTLVSEVGPGALYFKAFFSSENNTGLIRLKEVKVQGVDQGL